jgi:hypothetical protein
MSVVLLVIQVAFIYLNICLWRSPISTGDVVGNNVLTLFRAVELNHIDFLQFIKTTRIIGFLYAIQKTEYRSSVSVAAPLGGAISSQ